MQAIMIILIGIACLVVGVLLHAGYDYLAARKWSKSINFTAEQQKVKQELVEKKTATEKEMSDEIEAVIQKKKEALHEVEKEYDYKEKSYQEAAQQLEEDYQKTRQRYQEMDEQLELERQKENAEIISKATKSREAKLACLNADYEKKQEELRVNFLNFSDEINMKKAALTEEIKAFEQKQAAIVEQFKKDEELRKQRDFYHITIDSLSESDIKKLKSMAPGFSRPEIFYKLLYETYYKTAIENLFKQVLGENKEKGGIYKITNINNEKVYIGKTTKFIDRWRTHAKRGCNIERISGQIYDAMFDEGLENFTWEIVEVCPKEEQTEKEKYWIEFYHSDQYGYNIRKG
jgi:hypothetical protein